VQLRPQMVYCIRNYFTLIFDHSHEHRDDFLSKLIRTLRGFTNVARPSSFDHLTRKEPFREQKLSRLIASPVLAGSAVIDVSIIERLQHAKVYSAVGELPVAIASWESHLRVLVEGLAMFMDVQSLPQAICLPATRQMTPTDNPNRRGKNR
jgi:hypothetical protein